MIVYPKGKRIIEKLFELNSFGGFEARPLIAVIRNSSFNDGNLIFCPDTGDNNCDTILLIDATACIALAGRSFPHKKYQAEQVAGISNTNYIASGWYPMAWIKGYHFQYPALRQHVKFVIWRSRDMVLGNDDDYNQTDIVADNFHGFAPWSAGCVTVCGVMYAQGGGDQDWKTAYDWIYSKPDAYFSAVIFNFRDVESIEKNVLKLRIGSTGDRVLAMQELLSKHSTEFTADGEFGPRTHAAVRLFQAKNRLVDDGICGPVTLAALEAQA